MQRDAPPLPKEEVLERLAAGPAGAIAVVTPNRRMAQALRRDFDRMQRGRGRSAWETADILPFEAFVRRLWEDAVHAAAGESLPLALSPHQEQTLWEESITASRPALAAHAIPAAAAQCVEAWRLRHAWRLPPGSRATLSEDAAAFGDWSARYERATRERRQVDGAHLPEAVAGLLADAALRKPRLLVAYGFDLVTPQMRAFFDALAAHGCAVIAAAAAPRAARVTRLAFDDAAREILAAARWARARLEADPQARIGVVVPDLAHSRAAVERAFASVLRPASQLAGDGAALPFTLSLGRALADYPVAHDALAVLELAGPGMRFERASRVLRSPFIAGGVTEMAARARLDRWLRERCSTDVDLEQLLGLCRASKAPRAPGLVARLERLAALRKAELFGMQSAAEWALGFSNALAAIGFPGERALDSREHQALAKWHELLGEAASLERVSGRCGYRQARERLARMARSTVFQPQSPEVPIHVMGVLESAGIDFDHLWVTGLSDEAWPLPRRPNPFVPIAAQRAAGIPQADPAASAELDRRITAGWTGAAGEVVFSHFRMQGESELLPSPLVATMAESTFAALGVPAYVVARDAIRAAGTIETLTDSSGPPPAAGVRSGGTSLFRDQAACPFRGFARHRLASEPLEAPQHGLDARDRGSLVHCMLAAAWKALGTHARLVAMPEAQLEQLAAAAVDEAIGSVRRYRAEALGGRFGELERERLVRLCRAWLALEARRAPFAVVATEEKQPMTFGGTSVNVKLDRMDRLEAGGDAILDYKTGPCKTRTWMGERPEEPQLPMYALARGGAVAAVAFAQVRPGEMCFRGIARADGLIPGVKPIADDRSPAARQYRDWDALLAGWRAELEAIGRGFASGDARVDPKNGAATCNTCDQQMLCRIAEKAPFGAVGGGERDE